MVRRRDEEQLGMMNASIALVVLIPLLLMLWSAPRGAATSSDGTRDHDLPPMPAVDQPPIITISDTEVFSFPSGTADVTSAFRSFLTFTVVPRLVNLMQRYTCDIVEIVGHTDSQRVRTRSNLDDALLKVLAGRRDRLAPGSNADLGLMRAWAVAEILSADGRLSGKTFYGYSAADAIAPNGGLAPSIVRPPTMADRRRVEIRVRRRL